MKRNLRAEKSVQTHGLENISSCPNFDEPKPARVMPVFYLRKVAQQHRKI
jgi:hypothetical protein